MVKVIKNCYVIASIILISVGFYSQASAETATNGVSPGVLQSVSRWTGAYGGLGFGYATYQANRTSVLASGTPNGPALIGRVGYDQQFGSLVVGGFADIFVGNGKDNQSLGRDASTWRSQTLVNTNLRFGYAKEAVLFYVLGGYSWNEMSFKRSAIVMGGVVVVTSIDRYRLKADGINIGLGIEYQVAKNWSLYGDYRHVFARRMAVASPFASARASTGLAVFGANYRF